MVEALIVELVMKEMTEDKNESDEGACDETANKR